MNTQVCNRNHGVDSVRDRILSRLHESQAHPGWTRHKCAKCAYEEGYKQGYKSSRFACPVSKTNDFDFDKIPKSQAGEGVQRHKCCICAFQRGFKKGQEAKARET